MLWCHAGPAHDLYTGQYVLEYSDRRPLQSTQFFSPLFTDAKGYLHYSRGIYIVFSRSNFVSLSRSIRDRQHWAGAPADCLCALPLQHWRVSLAVPLWCHPSDGMRLVAWGHRYKNAHNFVINDQTCLKLFIRALNITIYLPQHLW